MPTRERRLKAEAKKAAAKKPIKKSAKSAKKSAAKRKSAGVLDHIESMFSRKNGVTFKEGVAELSEKFKDRKPEKLAVTMRSQITKLPVSRNFKLGRELKEGRGLVYSKIESAKSAAAGQ